MNLNKIYPTVDLEINEIMLNSKEQKPNSLFIDIHNSLEYTKEAIKNGAICVITKINYDIDIDQIIVDDPRVELAYIASSMYDYPSLKLKLLGVTGTDGKTTTATIFQSIMDDCGYIGTNGISYRNINIKTNNTTPNSLTINQSFKKMINSNIKHCALELSSHAINEKRICNLLFDCIIFTNLSKEHLDYHKSMDQYYQTKKEIFKNIKSNGLAIINNDDFYGRKLMMEIKQKIMTFGIDSYSDVMAKNIRKNEFFILFDLVYNDIIYPDFKLNLPCIFNVYNALGAICGLIYYGLDILEIKEKLERVSQIKGRMLNLTKNEPYNFIIDFAHTPNALYYLLSEARSFTKNNLVIVFGCGGNKDRSKRPIMGSIATTIADFVIFTSDDPKDEDVNEIIKDMTSYVEKENYLVILDRKKAIEMAVRITNSDDTIIISGKGEETEFHDQYHSYHYSDKEELIKALKLYKHIEAL